MATGIRPHAARTHEFAPTDCHPLLSRIAAASDLDEIDPDHHLWRNGRLWWIAFTVHRGHLQERVRFSLATADVEQARRRRDEVFALYEESQKCRISIRLKHSNRRSARLKRRTSSRAARARSSGVR
jgi:hypothetical protein